MLLSVVVPAYNEEGNLEHLHDRLTQVLESCAAKGMISSHELVIVDDGSKDRTAQLIADLVAKDSRVRGYSFSRNFGHEMATTAGVDYARGDAVVLIDADLQDPPELIEEMCRRWRAGAQVVYAQRSKREGETLLKKSTAFLFYRIVASISEVRIPHDTGQFRLMDRRVVDELRRLSEFPRFTRGLVSWVGFRQESLPYRRLPRHAGKSGYNYPRLMRLATDGICSFSTVPLWSAIFLGLFVTSLVALATIVVVVDKLFISPEIPRGIAFLTCAVFFMGGIQLIVLGVIGTYVGQIFRNVQRRPMYIIAQTYEASSPASIAEVKIPRAHSDSLA